MPGKVKVKIVAARGLPVMDRSSDLADAFAEVKLGNTVYKTDVYKKSLNPIWNSDWYRFEVDDEELQEESLQLRIMDYDTYTAHDAIGKVIISLNCLLTRDAPSSVSGWFPIYDTINGIRGEIKIIIKVDFFVDANKFRQSSCGVQFFNSKSLRVPSSSTSADIFQGKTMHRGRYTEIYVYIVYRRGGLDRKILSQGFENGPMPMTDGKCFSIQTDLNAPSVPTCYKTVEFHGFVEELVVNDDPEYQWIDNFRTPRSSNEARQRLFQQLSGMGTSKAWLIEREHGLEGELQRKIGLKVLDLGGNAVIGYQQYFDLEGESGIVVRAIGTCVSLQKIFPTSSPTTPTNYGASPRDSTGAQELFMACDLSKSFPPPRQRRRTSSTESDGGSPLKDSSGSADTASLSGLPVSKIPRQAMSKKRTIEEFEFPFFTLTKFPSGFLRNIGGVVSARSVKLLDRINNPDEPETRDSWWSEIRTEIRSHAKAVGCHAVVGYSESSTICDELIVLSAIGTAACVNLEMDLKTAGPMKSIAQNSCPSQPESEAWVGNSGSGPRSSLYLSVTPTEDPVAGARFREVCSVCHVPYMDSDIPMPVQLTKCFVCKQAKVPDMLFSTIEMPSELQIIGKGCLLQGRVCRSKRKEKGEANAELVSNILPFLEYELHRQLTNKLKLKGMNALFGLQMQVSVGDCIIIALGTATAVYLSCLPPPPILRVVGKTTTTDEGKRLKNIQKRILDITAKNRIRYKLDELGDSSSIGNAQALMADVSFDESLEDKGNLDPSFGSREAFVVEVDDKQDEDVITFLFDPPTPEGFYCGTTDVVPGVSVAERRMQMITAVKRIPVCDDDIGQNKQITRLFDSIIKSFWFKLRRLSPCSISNFRFDLEIPMADNVQVAVNAYVVALQRQPTEGSVHLAGRTDKKESRKTSGLLKLGKAEPCSSESDDLQFQIDEVSHGKPPESPGSTALYQPPLDGRLKLKLPPLPFRPKVEITPMCCVPGGHTERYLGNINLFFIRESLSIRENGGLNYFIQVFIGEVHAVLRAHVLALGGNALTTFRLNKLVLLDSPHKNQGQILLNVCGDVVEVNYKDENTPRPENRSRQRRSFSCCEEVVVQKNVRWRSTSINEPTI